MPSKKPHRFYNLFSIAALATGLLVSACAMPQGLMATRHETAMNAAMPAYMVKRHIEAGPFILTVFERLNRPGGEANIYIEGDGLAWVSRSTPSLDPTPINPLALRLAAQDSAKNVIYMARPCQYSNMAAPNKPCPIANWTSKRFSPEIINAMNDAINEIKNRYNLRGLHLVGYSGGATIAAHIAANRTDVLSLRTISGNLDHDVTTKYQNVSPLRGSLNAVTSAPKLADMPQHHFIGEKDKVVPPAALQSFRNAMGKTTCLRSTIVRNTSHEEGWVAYWRELLKEPLDCNSE